jgi:opacity protein-like surface antigen
MKTTMKSLAMATVVLFLAAPLARAQHRSFITRDAGPYFSFDMGPTFPQDGSITEFTGFASGNRVSYDVGLGMDFAGGYAFNKWVAAELAFGWTWNSISSIEGMNLDSTTLFNAPIFANVILQYPIPRTRVVPYLGGGVGGAATVFDTEGLYRPAYPGTLSVYGNDSDFVFSYQGFAGVRVDLNDKMSLGLGYKYLAVDSSSYTFPSYYYGYPDLHIGLSAQQVHLITFSFTAKY